MRKTCFVAALAIGASVSQAQTAQAQTVELRVVERQGRTTVTGPADAQLNFAVQARVVGGAPTLSLGQVGFTIHLVGEPDSNGTLARGLISNVDHTYTSDIGVSATVGRGGLASQYTYLAAINPGLNGEINTSAGGFLNGPDQEISIIAGDSLGGALLGTPGIDADQDGNPDLWAGNASGTAPAEGATAPVDATIAGTYFGAGGQWIDVYRFRYVVTNFPSHSFNVHLESVSVGIASDMYFHVGLWGLRTVWGTASTPDDWSILVADPGMGSCCDLASGTCSIARAADCTGAFLDTTSCTPTTCPPVGKCCDTAGTCFFVIQGFCDNTWTATGTCDPNPCAQLGSCCDVQAACLMRLQSLCLGLWTASGTCTPNVCPPVGHCCTYQGGCSLAPQPWCGGALTWGADASCAPSPCGPVSCCNNSTAACTMSNTGGCPTGSSFGGVGTFCSPSPCRTVACCNPSTRGCTLAGAVGGCPDGTVGQAPNTTCNPNLCPGVVCCDSTTGACAIAGQTCSAGSTMVGAGTTCATVSCPTTACCSPQTGTCTIVGVAGTCPAGTNSQGPNTLCSPNRCPALACCSPTSGACTLVGIGGTCPAGDFGLGPNTSCTPNLCPPPGRCCAADGSCTVTLSAGCPGGWSSDPGCSPNYCPQLGACCQAGQCVMLTVNACHGDGRAFRGLGTLCGPPNNRLDCCPANFNRVNGVDINDLLDFSAAWFGHEAAADFDHDGALTVSDYMQFLTAWIAGCQ